MTHNGDFVTYGRWEEANNALKDRVAAVERQIGGLSGEEARDQAMSARLTAVEDRVKFDAEDSRSRRGHIWLLIAAIVGSFVLPLAVSTVVTLLHLRSAGL